MGLRYGSPLACSVNMRGRATAHTRLYATTWHPSHHLHLDELQNPTYAWGASTPTRGVPSLCVLTLWRHCCDVDRPRRHGACYRDDHEEETIVMDYLLYTDAGLHWITSQLFFRCTTCLVVMIYDLLLTSLLWWHGRSSASIAYPYCYIGIRAIFHSSWPRSCAIVICDGYKGLE
jgi:hypothetical protein